MIITTNNQPRELVAFADLPLKVRADFDYIKPDDHYDARLFQYRGEWHDLHEFLRITPLNMINGGHPVASDSPLARWDGIQSDTFFSGTLVRYMHDTDCVIVGRYFA